jgi:hypothetical protein
VITKRGRRYVDVGLTAEILEPRLCLSAISFDTRTIHFGHQSTPFTVSIPDLNDDGERDVLMALKGEDEILWYENTGSLDRFIRHTVGRGDDVFAAYAVDLDGDLDLDVVTGSEEGKIVAWFENDDGLFYGDDPNDSASDGKGLLSMLDVPGENDWVMRHGTAIAVGDVDGDGDVDIVAAYDVDDLYGTHSEIAWFSNRGGTNGFAPPTTIAISDGPVTMRTESLVLGDLDLDGDIDVITASTNTNRVEWFENVDGSWQVFELHLLGSDWNEPSSVLAVDLDQDGDLDIAAASTGGSDVGWYENMDGKATFAERVILVNDSIRPLSIDFKDLSGDGNLDLLIAEGRDEESLARMVWYRGSDDPLSFDSRSLMVASSIISSTIFAGDIDQDGDLDVLAGTTEQREIDSIVLFEQRMIGDVDRDGRFDSSDLLEVFRNGEYEDGLFRNSTFDEGDWNGDDEFTSSDLILALQAGHYESLAAIVLDQALITDVASAINSRAHRARGNAFVS